MLFRDMRMNKIVFLIIFFPVFCQAQDDAIFKIAKEVSTADLKKNLYHLASPQMEGRFTGSRGDSLASNYIAQWFKQHSVQAPYQNGLNYFQPVDLNRIKLISGEIKSNGSAYRQFDDWYVFLRNLSEVRLNSLPVVFAGYGITSDRYSDLNGIDVKGKAVIIVQANPSDDIRGLLSSATASSINADYQQNLVDRGAAAILVSTQDFSRTAASIQQSPQLYSYRNRGTFINPIPKIYVSEKMINDLLKPMDISLQNITGLMKQTRRAQSFQAKSTISIHMQVDSVKEYAPNVIGYIRGRDTAAEPVVMSAHHDHLGKAGNNIFYGAVDNASGTATLMELAKLMNKAVQKGLRPKRTVIFASFTGEELGLLGSLYFTSHSFYPIEKTRVCYNIDMVGRVDSVYSGKIADSNYVYFFYRDSLNTGLHSALLKANESVGLKLDNRYQQSEFSDRRLKGSDHYPFYLKGVPVLRTDCGFAKDYHQVTDTPDKINYPLLTRHTQLAFLTLWNLANE